MEKIDVDAIREELKKHPPCLVAKETGITYQQVYNFLREKSYNPRLETLNAMINFINKKQGE